jgi:hypothetical protein
MADDNKKKNKTQTDQESQEDELRSGGLLGDGLKKLISAGVTAAFMTEESIRTYLGDIKLPRDVLNTLLQGASRSKDEIVQRVTKEVVSVLNQIDYVKEASRFIEEHRFRITAEIDVIKKPSATSPVDSAKDSKSATSWKIEKQD